MYYGVEDTGLGQDTVNLQLLTMSPAGELVHALPPSPVPLGRRCKLAWAGFSDDLSLCFADSRADVFLRRNDGCWLKVVSGCPGTVVEVVESVRTVRYISVETCLEDWPPPLEEMPFSLPLLPTDEALEPIEVAIAYQSCFKTRGHFDKTGHDKLRMELFEELLNEGLEQLAADVAGLMVGTERRQAMELAERRAPHGILTAHLKQLLSSVGDDTPRHGAQITDPTLIQEAESLLRGTWDPASENGLEPCSETHWRQRLAACLTPVLVKPAPDFPSQPANEWPGDLVLESTSNDGTEHRDVGSTRGRRKRRKRRRRRRRYRTNTPATVEETMHQEEDEEDQEEPATAEETIHEEQEEQEKEESPTAVGTMPVEQEQEEQEAVRAATCEHCLQEPCIVQQRRLKLPKKASSPGPANSEERRRLYRSAWRVLKSIGFWQQPQYRRRKVSAPGPEPLGQMALHSRREVMPECIVKRIRELRPNQPNKPYMGHRWR
ncbi:uncharacterized protein [Dermacentor albipictus]|uniref:uncharacterized protein n=1 Tax=Dermacentor albipictus TaxID=60249 RepID=UPI0038FC43E0